MPKLPPDFIKTSQLCGLEHALDSQGHFYAEKNKVLSSFAPKGVELKSRETEKGIEADVVIKKGVKLKESLYFCFGMLGKTDEQQIIPNIILEEGAEVNITAHCSFPHAEQATHEMEAVYDIGKNAKLTYNEYHYHGKASGAKVYPKLKINVAEGGEFTSTFSLT